MTAEEIRGRGILTTYLALLVVSDALISLLSIGPGTRGWLPRAIRLALTICLCSALYRGNIYAKLLAIVLMGLGGVVGIIAIVGVGATARDGVAALPLLGLVALFLSFVVVLISSRSVNAFLAYQRGERTGLADDDQSSGLLPESAVTCPMCGAPIEPESRKCDVCGEGSIGPQNSAASRSNKSSSRRKLAIAAVVAVPLLLFAVLRFTRSVPTYTRITMSYPHAPPDQVEAQIGRPMETAINGSPGLKYMTVFCSHGKAEIDLTWDGPYDETKLAERLYYAGDDLPQGIAAPVVTKVLEVRPVVEEHAVALVAFVEPDKQALARYGVREADVWKAAMVVYAVTDDVELQIALLERAQVESEADDVLLTDVATVSAAERPICIVRYMGTRIEDLPIEFRPRARN